MTDVRVLLAQNMKHFRELSGISQMKLAEMIDCSPDMVGKIETMKRFPSADTLNRLAKALRIAPSDLFLDTGTSEIMKAIASLQKRKSQFKSKINKAVDELFI